MGGGGPERRPQVMRAMNEAAELSAAKDRSQPTPTLLAYSDGSVTANGALGSVAAMLCIGVHDVSAVARLTSADTALSSGRSEWTGLLLVLYIAKHVRGDLAVRLGNLQVVNAFTDGPWRFRSNWLRRNDRDLVSHAWHLANDRQLAGLGSTTVLHQLAWAPREAQVAGAVRHARGVQLQGRRAHAPDQRRFAALRLLPPRAPRPHHGLVRAAR